jgi:predicted amidohydrolase
MKVALVQTKANFSRERAVERLKRTVMEGDADLYVFPEMYLTGYLIRDEVHRQAVSVDSPIIREIAEVARSADTHIIFGFPERCGTAVYNSAALVHPDGRVDVAQKIHLPNFGPFEEVLYFTPGERPAVFNTALGRIGVQICYDLFFPELAKAQALAGADVIVNISASPTVSRVFFERVLPARAIENTVFMIYVNWVGRQRNLIFWGGSRCISPRGMEVAIAPYFREHTLMCDVDMEELNVARRLRPTLRDTRLTFPASY